MSEYLHLVFWQTWWQYAEQDLSWFSFAYHHFNLLEGVAWCVFCLLVLTRYLKHRMSRWEIVYAVTFFAFGLTDFREAYVQSSALIWFKLFNLIALLWLRKKVMQLYPQSKLY